MLKNVLILILLQFQLTTYCQSTFVSGMLNTNTTWAGDTVWLVGDVVIRDGVTLRVLPNTKIIAKGHYKLDVKGRLVALGQPAQMITFTIQDTTGFTDTTSTRGSWNGIHFENIQPTNDSSILKYCKISYGKAIGQTRKEQLGGAIYIDSTSKIQIESCEIYQNVALWSGAGIYIHQNSHPKILKNLIRNNASYVYGGGISSLENSAPLIHQNIVTNNIAIGFNGGWRLGAGGGIYISSQSSVPVVSCNLISNNLCTSGALYESTIYIKIINNIVVNNDGYGIFNGTQRSEAIYANNTICNNMEPGVYSNATGLTLYNNILRGNVPVFNPQGPENVTAAPGYWPRVYHNNIGNPRHLINYGNIDSATLFVRPTTIAGLSAAGYEADWRLRAGSPDIDKGFVNNIASFIGDKDILGNPRIAGRAIDIGAIEYQPLNGMTITQAHPQIKIYPNPFTNQFWIEILERTTPLTYRLFSINGPLVHAQPLQTDINLIQLDDFANGTYLLQIQDASGKVFFSSKIVKM